MTAVSDGPRSVAFGFGDWRGRVRLPGPQPPPREIRAAVEHAIDPANAVKTLYWGRNYLYLAELPTPAGPLPVAVKQFKNQGWRRRTRRRLSGSKAEKSWRAAHALLAAGVLTPEPVLLAESDHPEGASYYACRHLDDALEARYLLRAANVGTAERDFPEADVDAFLVALAGTLRRLHEARLWHRDMSSGNVLIRWRGDGAPPDLYLLDLNRTRIGRRLTPAQRMQDLARMGIQRREHQRRLLELYWGKAGPLRTALYRLYHHGFRFKHEAKRVLRRRLRGLWQAAKDLLLPRSTHVHIPRAPEGVSTRDRVVWDHLSDQPHLHAGKMEKHLTRLRDAPAHLRGFAAAAAAAPAAWRRYRELAASRFAEPVPFAGAGVALRPRPDAPEELLAAVDELGVRQWLLRLHPWDDDHGAEEELARELAARGLDLTFALPQNRDLVRDPQRWRAAVAELGERFRPHGSRFVVGQAVNRSKWGVWNPEELRRLAVVADEELRRHDGVEILGPGVIDFEPHATLGLVNYPGMPRFDGLASLLYVDRRGAPETPQAGFDATGKATLLRAIADTAAHCAPRSWITEVNWPLREGPHAPAGRMVAVDEDTQADYLVRYLVPVLTAGWTERVYWWQLAARGYGLLCPEEDGGGGGPRVRLLRRPAFHALRTLLRELDGTACLGPLVTVPDVARAYRFRRPDGGEVVVAWAVESTTTRIVLPGELEVALDRDGRPVEVERRPILGDAPCYFRLAPGTATIPPSDRTGE